MATWLSKDRLHCAIELKKGETAKSIAKKFRELALEVERLENGSAERFCRQGLFIAVRRSASTMVQI